MATSRIAYLGNLRTSNTHVKSGTDIETDAPFDNNGKGEKFSPTDLVATAYASCMFTIIGIYCDEHGIEFKNGSAEVEKIMGSNPRRISGINIKLDLTGNDWNEKTKISIIRSAEACPVAKSIHPDIEVNIDYIF